MLQQWIEYCADVRVNGPLPVKLTCLGEEDGAVRLLIEMQTTDAVSGGPKTVRSIQVTKDLPTPSVVFAIISRLYAHELAEQLHVNDERPLDPHVDGPLLATHQGFLIGGVEDSSPYWDNYKSKEIRKRLPTPPWDTSLQPGNLLGLVLHVIGTSDNQIGGLHGAADFLPDDPNSEII